MHSPLPWKVETCHTGEDCWCRLIKHSEEGWENIDDLDEPYVNIAGSIPKDDVEFIVKACNNHYKLIEVLEELVVLIHDNIEGLYQIDSFTTQPAKELLKSIKGK